MTRYARWWVAWHAASLAVLAVASTQWRSDAPVPLWLAAVPFALVVHAGWRLYAERRFGPLSAREIWRRADGYYENRADGAWVTLPGVGDFKVAAHQVAFIDACFIVNGRPYPYYVQPRELWERLR